MVSGFWVSNCPIKIGHRCVTCDFSLSWAGILSVLQPTGWVMCRQSSSLVCSGWRPAQIFVSCGNDHIGQRWVRGFILNFSNVALTQANTAPFHMATQHQGQWSHTLRPKSEESARKSKKCPFRKWALYCKYEIRKKKRFLSLDFLLGSNFSTVNYTHEKYCKASFSSTLLGPSQHF